MTEQNTWKEYAQILRVLFLTLFSIMGLTNPQPPVMIQHMERGRLGVSGMYFQTHL